MSNSDYQAITKAKPEKSLLRPLHRTSGRNARGRMTVWTKSGGHKRRYRKIDFRRVEKAGVPAKVEAVEYDPNRSANIALLLYADGERRYILAPQGVTVGTRVVAGESVAIRPGNALPLSRVPVGTLVHSVEMKIGKGAQLCRSAGAYAQIMAKEGNRALLRLPSGEVRQVHQRCWATIGQVGNAEHGNIKLGKAGRSRWLGRKPGVRGIAMNPIDHPHGGGEGRVKGNHPQTPWGQPTQGYRTRKQRKPSDRWIVRRRRSRKK